MQRRDFIFIEDAIDAINTILVAESSKPAGFENYDLGTGASTSIRELVETIKTITNSSSILNFGILKRREGEFINSFADIKLLKRLGWTQNTSLLNGLTATVNYYK
jgi:nucleoside-diphosphate-sugar epimerase